MQDLVREYMSRIFKIFTICRILGGPVIGDLCRGLPKRCRCVKNLTCNNVVFILTRNWYFVKF